MCLSQRPKTNRVLVAMATQAEAEITPLSTVLVVESDVIVRTAISGYLRECGYKVVEAGNGAEAMRVLQSDIVVDVLFTEVELPGAPDGFGLATWVRGEKANIKVILASSVGRAARQAGDLCEHGPMLTKPYDHSDLERHIRRLLGRGAV
jgi:CheY-like chemotaxis protein